MNSKEVYGSLLGSLALFLCVIAASYTSRFLFRRLFPRRQQLTQIQVPPRKEIQNEQDPPPYSWAVRHTNFPTVPRCHNPETGTIELAQVNPGPSGNTNEVVVVVMPDIPPHAPSVLGSKPTFYKPPSVSSQVVAKEELPSPSNENSGAVLFPESSNLKDASSSHLVQLLASEAIILEETNDFVVYKL